MGSPDEPTAHPDIDAEFARIISQLGSAKPRTLTREQVKSLMEDERRPNGSAIYSDGEWRSARWLPFIVLIVPALAALWFLAAR